jgi:hypothetical protein
MVSTVIGPVVIAAYPDGLSILTPVSINLILAEIALLSYIVRLIGTADFMDK